MENVHPLRLRLLLEIERTGSISAAAAACAIAQPSASIHLRTLETAVGERLVTRNGRGSTLTSAGRVVASHAAEVLAALEGMRRDLDALDEHQDLTIAASLTPSVVLVPRILRRLSTSHPGMLTRLRTLPSSEVVTAVVRGSASIGIAGEVPISEPVIRKPLVVEELVGIAPVGMVSSGADCLSIAELARHSLLVGGEMSSTRLATDRALARVGYRPMRVCVFDSYATIPSAVADGLGVSFVSRVLVRDRIERGELVPFRVRGVPPITRPIHIVQPAARALTPEAAAFAALVDQAPWAAADRPGPAGPIDSTR